MRKRWKWQEDGGVALQRAREAAEHQARFTARAGDEHEELLAEAARYASKGDWRKRGQGLPPGHRPETRQAHGVPQPRCNAHQLGTRRGGR